VITTGKAVRDEQGQIVKVLGGTLDVTHTRGLEEQLRQAQKLEAIGSLAAGIAHNFNNMLAVILPTLEIVEPRVCAEHERLIRHARHAAQRAAELVRELMTYAGHSASQAKVSCNLDSLVDAATEICRRTFDAHIELAVEHLLAPTPVVHCNPVQIEQVLVNLLLNARDAILEAHALRGRVLVRVRGAEPASASGEEAICIDVTDDGVGMDEQTRVRVFEPFFTTKGVGKGTGLGLATSYAIVRDHRGSLRVTSTPGQGSTFTITLPRSPVLPSLLPAQPAKLPSLKANVLLVDDDEHVRGTLQQVLAHAGLGVRVANSGESALQALQQAPDTDVILLDRAMPGGAGEHFVPRMREICPQARIAFLSGQITEEALSKLADAVIPKPITGSALLHAIGELLEAP
jgi:nitrogen-specific signal transduction histidine kinase/CheY-like chemotaxis protein